jgi:hypothetical protein
MGRHGSCAPCDGHPSSAVLGIGVSGPFAPGIVVEIGQQYGGLWPPRLPSRHGGWRAWLPRLSPTVETCLGGSLASPVVETCLGEKFFVARVG